MKASIAYCTKEDTRVVGTLPWVGGGVAPPRKPSFLSREQLWGWQEGVVVLHESEPDDRTIHWYWEEVGHVGKTALLRHLVGSYPGDVLVVGGKGADMKYAIGVFIEKHGHAPRTVCYNLSRSREAFFSYEGAEAIKDGLCFSSKYESGMLFFNPPHIIVMANWEPDRSQMSKDRWSVHHVAVPRDPQPPPPLTPLRDVEVGDAWREPLAPRAADAYEFPNMDIDM